MISKKPQTAVGYCVWKFWQLPVMVAVRCSKHSLLHITASARGKWRLSFEQSSIGNELDEMENAEKMHMTFSGLIFWGSALFQEMILILYECTASPSHVLSLRCSKEYKWNTFNSWTSQSGVSWSIKFIWRRGLLFEVVSPSKQQANSGGFMTSGAHLCFPHSCLYTLVTPQQESQEELPHINQMSWKDIVGNNFMALRKHGVTLFWR